jgi:YVTN family beta-propeller protein
MRSNRKNKRIYELACVFFIVGIGVIMLTMIFGAAIPAYSYVPVPVAVSHTPTPTSQFIIHPTGVAVTTKTPTPTVFLPHPVPVQVGTPLAYVCSGSNIVTVINMNENKVVASIVVGYLPHGMGVSPDGTKVYVADSGNNMVTVIDTASNTAIANISVGTFPSDVAVSKDGKKAYVTNSNDNTVSIIDTTTNSVIKTIGVGKSPWGVTVNPNNGDVFVANSMDFNVMQLRNDAVYRTIALGNGPFGGPSMGIRCTPDGSRLYVAMDGDNVVIDVDLSTYTKKTINVKTQPCSISISPDGKTVYVPCLFGHNVSVIDTATDVVTDNIMMISSLSASAIRPDGKMLYVSEGDHEVTVIDTAAKMVKTHIDIGGHGLDFAVANVVLASPTAVPSQAASPAPSQAASPAPSQSPSKAPQPSEQTPSQSTGGATISPDASSGILPTPTVISNQTSGNASGVSASPTTGGFEIWLAILGIFGAMSILIKKD